MSLKTFCDVLILGGGPAGTATALALARLGHSAIVVERSGYDDFRVGETLPPQAKRCLLELGVWERFLQSQPTLSLGIQSAWGNRDLHENHFIFNPYGTGWHVDRQGFDGLLSHAAEAVGIEVLRRTRVSRISRQGRSWRVCLGEGERQTAVEARFLVDATGRTGLLARSQGRSLSLDRMIGLIGILTPRSIRITVRNTLLLESTSEGWWYSVPLPDGSLLAAFMTDADGLWSNQQWHESCCQPMSAGDSLLRERTDTRPEARNLTLYWLAQLRVLWPEQDLQSVTKATAFRRWLSLILSPLPSAARLIEKRRRVRVRLPNR